MDAIRIGEFLLAATADGGLEIRQAGELIARAEPADVQADKVARSVWFVLSE